MWKLTRQGEDRLYRALPVLVGVAGLAAFAHGLYSGRAWITVPGLMIALIAFTFPRLKGEVQIALGALKFKGELTALPDDRTEEDEETVLPGNTEVREN